MKHSEQGNTPGKRFEYQTYEVFIIQSPPAVFHDLIATAKIMAYANSF